MTLEEAQRLKLCPETNPSETVKFKDESDEGCLTGDNPDVSKIVFEIINLASKNVLKWIQNENIIIPHS